MGCCQTGAGCYADAEGLSLDGAGRIQRPAAVELVEPHACLVQFTYRVHAEYLLMTFLESLYAKGKQPFGFKQVKQYFSFANPTWPILCICPVIHF